MSTTRTPGRRTAAAPAVDELTAQVLGELQARFPILERPYAVVAARLGVAEEDVQGALERARASGRLRQLSAIFDTRSLGYDSSLVAMRVPETRLARAVAVVNAHPGVSHNYERDHDFNLWLTVATPPHESLAEVLDELGDLAGAESVRAFPTLRLFKIGVALDATGRVRGGRETEEWYSDDRRPAKGARPLDAFDIAFVRAAQEDLSADADPFAAIAQALGVPVANVIESAQRMSRSGQLRRVAAILDHRRAGFRANGMAVWQVAQERIDEVGRAFAERRCVTHCYERPSYPDWPYRVFTMIHGGDRSEVEASVAEMAQDVGVDAPRILYSTREFKKVRLRLFTPEEREWRERCREAACAPAGDRWGA